MAAGPAGDRAGLVRSGGILSRARENTGPRFALVFVLVLLMMALTMALPEGAGISLVALVAGLALITAVWASRVTDRFLRLVTAFVTIAAVLSIASLVLDSRASTTATAIVTTLFTVAVPIAIVVGLRDEREVNAQTIFGALSVYLLAGLFFTLLISVVARLTGSPYFAQETDGSLSERVYFSYITLATLGYGDLTPATSVGRALAVFEAIFGSLYLVTVLSFMISRFGRPRVGVGAGESLRDGSAER